MEKLFQFTMGKGTIDEVHTHKEDDDNGEIDESESQVRLSISTHEIEAFNNMKNGYMDQFSAVRTINKTLDGIQHSREFMATENSKCNQERLEPPGQGPHWKN